MVRGRVGIVVAGVGVVAVAGVIALLVYGTSRADKKAYVLNDTNRTVIVELCGDADVVIPAGETQAVFPYASASQGACPVVSDTARRTHLGCIYFHSRDGSGATERVRLSAMTPTRRELLNDCSR